MQHKIRDLTKSEVKELLHTAYPTIDTYMSVSDKDLVQLAKQIITAGHDYTQLLTIHLIELELLQIYNKSKQNTQEDYFEKSLQSIIQLVKVYQTNCLKFTNKNQQTQEKEI